MLHSIRLKATAITVLAVLTAVCCVLLASFSITQEETDQKSVEVMGLVAKDAQKTLEKYTDGIEQSVGLASNLAVDALDGVMLSQGGVIGSEAAREGRTPEQTRQLDSYLTDYANSVQADFETVATHTTGAVAYYYCISPGVSTEVHGFFCSRAGKTGFGEREPLDARLLDPMDQDHTAWYYAPIKRGQPMWVGPYEAQSMNDMDVCSYVVPIYKSGTLIGVLGMDIPLDTFVSLVSSIHVYQTGYACLVDDDGRVVYHPELSAGSTLRLPVDSAMLQREDSGDELIRYRYNGEELQMSFTTLAPNMKLVIVAPTAEVNASMERLAHVVTPVAVGIVALFATLTLLAMSFLTRPLLSLTTASRQLANANYDVELSYRGHDEIGELTGAFKRMRDQLKAYIADLNHRARTDDLTGLPNQRHFFELAEQEKRRLLEEGASPALLFFNLMGMKHFNRQYGFDEGDRLICKVARVLARNYGEERASHFGQDHFVVIADENGLEESLHIVFVECQAVNGGKSLPVSVGIYPSSLEDVNIGVACDRAKFACDRRRGSYYSGYLYFDESMLAQTDLFRYVVGHLDEALDQRWIKVEYQPIIRSVNGRVCDEEALSRWIDPIRGRLAPNEFIPALEDSGLIYKLDLYVLDRVLDKIKLEQESNLTIVPHSINLSRSDFDMLDIVEEIRRRVDDAGVARDRITIEITESIVGRDFSFMKRQVERFQALGFPVWMDDFGSGYSSLDLLQSIKFDLLKFDMSFLRKLDEGTGGKIILTELMQMATALGVGTLCEGVETQDQVRFLREIGCSKLQGYYYCKAISLSQILERHEQGIQIGYENPEESSYYEAVGKVNLHDLNAIAHEDEGEDEDSLYNIFNTLPMGIMEIKGDNAVFVRTNESYRDFAMRYVGINLTTHTENDSPTNGEAHFVQRVKECCAQGGRVYLDDTMPSGLSVRYLVRRVSSNPVTDAIAVAIAVLSISEPTA